MEQKVKNIETKLPQLRFNIKFGGLVSRVSGNENYQNIINLLIITTMSKKEKTVKSFVDYFVEKQRIDTKGIQCIRTRGWGEKAVLRVEYADYHKDFKPVILAKKYLQETYGYYPENLNFNNDHYDRISCSSLNVYDIRKEEYDKYRKLPTVIYAEFNKKEDWGAMAFLIHNDKQCALCYERRLYEYFSETN